MMMNSEIGADPSLNGNGQGVFKLRPTQLDLAIADCCELSATRTNQRIARVVTLLADEKAVLTLAGAVWLASRVLQGGPDQREADRLVCSAIVAGALPHVLKVLVARKRPDRCVQQPRNGVGKSGNAWDSFPSGHALHLGAIAKPLARLAPQRIRPWVWPAIVTLASSRVFVLAHYASDVLAGFAMGRGLDSGVERLLRRYQ